MYKLLNLVIAFTLLSAEIDLSAQQPNIKDYGLNHLKLNFEGESVDILIQQKKGEESIPKPIFFFCQGSLPQPLIKYSDQGMYGIFPFSTDSLLDDFHLVIVGKPSIPLMADVAELRRNFIFSDDAGNVPKGYIEKNLLNYYLERNLAVLDFLQKKPWVSKNQLIVAGHSEGSRIAVRMASKSEQITHLIYAGGNPYGRIMSIISQNRKRETDSTEYAAASFSYWEEIVKDHDNMEASDGDTYKATFQFSQPSVDIFKELEIPVLVSYGTQDEASPYNDLLRVEMIRAGKENITFHDYVGLDHNFFPISPDGNPDYSIFNWDKVVDDWKKWLKK